jgi:molybdate transport system substrate-binding protein
MRLGLIAFIAQTSLIMVLSQGITANAGEIKVLSTHAALEVLSELGPQFERSTGHKLSFPANIIKRQIEGGSAFDIAIVTRGVIDDLTKQGKIAADSRTDIGRSGLGVAVREGAFKPDISTVDGFRRDRVPAPTPRGATQPHRQQDR